MRVYVFKEFNDGMPYPCENEKIKVFFHKKDAEAALVHAVESITNCPYEDTGKWLANRPDLNINDWYHEGKEYASLLNDDYSYSFFAVEEYVVHTPADYKAQDDKTQAYIFKHYNDYDPYCDEEIQVFALKEDAENALVHAVEANTGVPYSDTGDWLEELGIVETQWCREGKSYMEFPDGDGSYSFFAVEEHTVK